MFWKIRNRIRAYRIIRQMKRIMRNSNISLEKKDQLLSHIMTKLTNKSWNVSIGYDGSITAMKENW